MRILNISTQNETHCKKRMNFSFFNFIIGDTLVWIPAIIFASVYFGIVNKIVPQTNQFSCGKFSSIFVLYKRRYWLNSFALRIDFESMEICSSGLTRTKYIYLILCSVDHKSRLIWNYRFFWDFDVDMCVF